MPTPVDRKLPQLNRVELHQTNFFLGLLLAFISLLPVAYLDIPVLYYYAFAMLVVSVAAFRPQIRLALPVQFWSAIPLFLLLTFTADVVVFAGVDGFLESLIRLNILLVCYRAVAFRKRRDDLQLILVCLFLVIIVALNTVSVVFILQMVVFAAISMVLLFNVNLLGNSERTETPQEVWTTFSWDHYLARLRESTHLRMFGLAVLLFVLILSLSAGIFLLIPRLGLENRLGFLGLRNSSSVAGFNEDIGLNDITNILSDNRTALRIDPPSRSALPADPYWRMLVLDQYRGDGRFRVSEALSMTRGALTTNRFSPADMEWERSDSDARERGKWLFYLEGGVARWLPLGGDFSSLRAKGRNRFLNIPAFRVVGQSSVNSQLFSYEIRDMEFQDRFPDPYMEKEDWPQPPEEITFMPEWREVYRDYRTTTLEIRVRERDFEYLDALVHRITEGRDLGPVEFAREATDYLAEYHAYSMSSRLPPGRGDPVVRWLRNGSDGHCEYFAGALVLLSRAAGHPARVVTGFRGGQWNGYEDYLMVRYSDAHAWCEIYDGEGHWVRVDPTPLSDGDGSGSGPHSDNLFGVGLDDSWMAYLDSLRVIWYRRVVSFDEETQSDILASLRNQFSTLREGTGEGISTAGATVREWMRGPWDFQRFFYLGGSFLVLALFIFLMQRLGWRLFPYFTFYRQGVRLNPVRRQAGTLLRRLESIEGETCGRDAADLPDKLVSVRDQLLNLRYGSPERRRNPGRVFREARLVMRRLRRG